MIQFQKYKNSVILVPKKLDAEELKTRAFHLLIGYSLPYSIFNVY